MRTRARAKRRRRCSRPRASAGPAPRSRSPVCSRVTPSSGRTRRPSAAAHPQQRAPARRGGQPVEDRLDLIGGGVTGREQRVVALAASRSPRRSELPRPRLQVARPLPAASRARTDVEAPPPALTQRRAATLLRRGLRAQAVVDVQRAHAPRRRQRDATSSRQTESRPPESIATSGRSRANRPSRARRSRPRSTLIAGASHRARCRDEQLGRLGEALQRRPRR